jgi:hypothetical protein
MYWSAYVRRAAGQYTGGDDMADVGRWGTIGVDLGDLIDHATPVQQRAAVAAAAILAAERTGLTDEPVPEAIELLRAGRIDAGLRNRLVELADDIDDQAFDKQDEVDEGRAEYSDHQAIFRRARAATALAVAMEEDAREAAAEGIYEAYHALGSDSGAIDAAIRSIFGQ